MNLPKASLPVTASPQLQDYLAASARRRPDKVGLVADGHRLTFAWVEARSNAFARALVRRGVRRGDRIVIYGDNGVETVLAFWATLKAGAVASVLTTQVKAEKLAHVIDDCRAAALITETRGLAAAAAAAARSPHLVARIHCGDSAEARAAGFDGAAGWDEAVAAESTDPIETRRLDVDLAAIVYSSGTMGEPKGVMLTHRNMIATATAIVTYLENVEDDVIGSVLPLSFTYGLYQLITAAAAGARLVLERSFAYPAQVLATMAHEGVTGFPGVPTVFARLATMPHLRDLATLRYITNAAAALPVRHVRMLRERLPHASLFLMYGQTECGRGTYLPPGEVDRRPESMGIAIPNTEVWLVDEHDRRVPANQVGQLVIRGATVMRGYWGKPEATARRLRPGPLPGELVLYTGDYCRADEDGYLTFVGRMDDTIKSRGEKVAPREVENAILEIPGVREAAVIGVPDALLGLAVKAFVVLEDDVSLTEKLVRTECQKRLEAYMVPQQIAFVADLPKTASGKIMKAQLR
jgi:amino acid adenylation domain-containing protein